MAIQAMMVGPDGADVKCFRRAARNARPGDWLPEYGARVVAEPVTDPESGRHWLTLDDGRDVEATPRGKVWLFRQYDSPAWMAEAVTAYRAARDAREALRESGHVVPTSVPGAAGSAVACYQLEPGDFDAAYPAPRLADYIREAAAARRDESGVAA